MIPPRLYHLTLNVGTLGGFKLKPPDILKCGNFMLGNDHLTLLNKLPILLNPLLIVVLAESSALDALEPILLNTDSAFCAISEAFVEA